MSIKKGNSTSGVKTYSRLLSYVIPYIPLFLISTLGFIILAASQVAAAEWLKQVIDFVNSPNDEYRILLPSALVVIAMFRGIGFFIGNYLMALISNKLVHDLRTDLFKKIMVLPSSYFDQQSSGHLISRITFNVVQVTGAATNAIKVIFREGLLVLGLIAYLLFLNWELTVVLLITAPFIALVVSIAARRLRKISTRIQNSMGDVTHVASETINAYKEVKAFGGEIYEDNRFTEASENNKRQNLKLEATNYASSPLIQIFVSTGLAIITWLALDSSVINVMSSGTFIAFFGAAGMLARPVRQLSEINSQIQKGLAAAEDIFNQLDEDDEEDNGKVELENINGEISFKNVSFSYEGADGLSKNVLKNIDLNIHKGQTIALVGKSGAGKTTLVNLIPRFYQNYEGEILIDNTPINDFTIQNLRSHISIVGQNITLFNDTVTKNINYGSIDGQHEEIINAAKRANADDFIRAMPDGYETMVGDDGVLLSGGQRQRIAIARAILKDSPILILDEATSALDSESEKFIQEAIEEVSKDRTTLIIAHRLSTVEKANLIIVLDEGKIIEQGTHSELLGAKGAYADLHANQFIDEKTKQIIPDRNDITVFRSDETPKSKISFLERAWIEKKSWLWLLWPLSLITRTISKYRRNLFKKNINKIYKSHVPVIVVGNISLGGTGKTSMVISLANTLKSIGYKPGIISRGYGGRSKKYPLKVTNEIDSDMAGDEPVLIFKNTSLPVYVGPNRLKVITQLLNETDCDVIISDDGLQHYNLNRDIEIAMIDGLRGLGNGLTIPAGPLREPIERLSDVNFIISTHQKWEEKKFSSDYIMKYEPSEWERIHDGQRFPFINWPLSKNAHAIAGIGNPEMFFKTLEDQGFNLIKHTFSDHYEYKLDDLIFDDDYPIIMTEKDAVRCLNMPLKNLWYFKINARLPEEFITNLTNNLKNE
ncbi:MAG: lipid A export permease/ATP-binding protein MsbA [SAR86 cluster bacterium]|nr:lipid A export permease/ATP-binding protein MsbA [SAR86 cluster bacterium]